jgi:hypothetical protein
MKNVVFWDVTPCGFRKNRRFGETYRNMLQLLLTANTFPSSLILFTLMMEAISSSENFCSYKSHTALRPRRGHSSGNLLFPECLVVFPKSSSFTFVRCWNFRFSCVLGLHCSILPGLQLHSAECSVRELSQLYTQVLEVVVTFSVSGLIKRL